MQITANVAKILRVMLADVAGEHYGSALRQTTGLSSSRVYPILGRVAAAGWATTGYEHVDPAVSGRRPRRYFQLTDVGVAAAQAGLDAFDGGGR